ncbi:MAG TPA: sulfite exporter TauE/SafE family protein, partial [Burkholderiaceae bacterium]|nr:sulfite exporter TauE/SafE family protein [Burkholderiaceae bacterium]
MFALAVPTLQAAAIMLPILIVQDVVSVLVFRRTWDGHVLAVMLPGAVVGIALGYLFAASLDERWVMGALGVISIAFAGQRLWAERGGRVVPARALPDWTGVLCGVGAGLTSQIAHAGGPPFQIWVLPRRLDREALLGTTAIYFATVNWIKVPAYVALDQFTAPNMIAAAALLP